MFLRLHWIVGGQKNIAGEEKDEEATLSVSSHLVLYLEKVPPGG